MLKRAGRRLLVSPWFAAGAGVVIAAGAIIYAPHANFAIDTQPCKTASCQRITPQIAQPLQIGPGNKVTVPPHAPSTPSVLAGMTFHYQVLDRSQYEFSMQITIKATHSISHWQLGFVIPGATNVYVYGAQWQQARTDGGTASSYNAGTESAGYAQISGHQDGGDGWSSWNGDIVQFQVRGTGTPSPPTQCYYDGKHCQFTGSLEPVPADWPSYG